MVSLAGEGPSQKKYPADSLTTGDSAQGVHGVPSLAGTAEKG
jgi:hypothetical protein